MPKLRAFQREDIDRIKDNDLCALVASSPGCGKTAIAVRSMFEAPNAFPAVVLCPASIVRNWRKEFGMWSQGLKIHLIEDTSSKLPKEHIDVFVLSWALLDLWEKRLTRRGVRTVVADEAHFIRHDDTLRSRAFHRLTRRPTHLMCLTGTPIVGRESDLDAIKSYFHRPPIVLRRLLEEVAKDVPPKKRSYLNIELRGHHRRDYDEANREFEDWLIKQKQKGDNPDGFEISDTAEALIKLGYLRRLAGEGKVPAAADWIGRMVRLGEPVVVFAEHQNPIYKLSKTLHRQRIRHCVLDGSTSIKARQKMVDDFQSYKFPVFIASKAGKEGITLTAARHLLFLERYFTAAEEEQSEDRIRRLGQLHPTTIWYMQALDTVDQRIDEIVNEKRAIFRRHLRSVTIDETPSSNVHALLARWEGHLKTGQKPSDLGLGDPLPPLPRPGNTHAVTFHGNRWDLAGAAKWCRMNGYHVTQKSDLGDRFQIIVHPAMVFKPRSFHLVKVSEDIRVLVGERLSAAHEKKVRRAYR